MQDKIIENYKEKEIIIETSGNEGKNIRMSIDGKHIHVMSLEGKFSSHYIPYIDYPTPLSLAKAIIDNVPEFSNKLNSTKEANH
jgi:hypothetical protein